LKKDPDGSYALFSGDIKFDYLNETTDSVWTINVYDVSENNRKVLPMDSIPLKPGENLVKYPAEKAMKLFSDKHFYQLEVSNSRGELWRLRFEFLKPTVTNN